MGNFGYTTETALPGLRDAYRALEPDPNAVYGAILPFAIDRTTGKPRWAMPAFLRDTLGGGLDLLAGLDTGEVTPRAALQLGLGGLSFGARMAPRGTLAMGGARPFRLNVDPLTGLKLDQGSRFARARSLGLNVDQPLYHGAPRPDFRSFAMVHPWEAVRIGQAPGIWTAENPALAAKFSTPEVRERIGLMGLPGGQGAREGTPRILPLLARSENPASLTLSPGDAWGNVNRAIADAFAGGHDAIALHNYRMFRELGPQTIWGFGHPSQLRSRFATFDPVKRDSSDLMAGFAAPLLPVPVSGFDARPEPGLAERAAWLRRMNEDGSWQ
jgi:hypothetical protein